MGYTLSTLARLPLDTENEFYIFILGGNANWKGGILQTIYDNFDTLAKAIGPSAIIAKGLNPREWTYEISRKYFYDIKEIDRYFPGILITNSHPDNFNEDSLRIFISLKHIEDNYDNIEQFFDLLTNFIRNKDRHFLDIARSKINWLDIANNTVDLKPNILGFGINFNVLLNLFSNKKDSPLIRE